MRETILKANKKRKNKYISYHKSIESFNVSKKVEHKERSKFKEKEYAL